MAAVVLPFNERVPKGGFLRPDQIYMRAGEVKEELGPNEAGA